ncbi:MAG: hypothetical protein H6923_08230 [Alphaproteobacteria bacterium]|nr:hypothetical protein [Alphaproteobacteria bacterium]
MASTTASDDATSRKASAEVMARLEHWRRRAGVAQAAAIQAILDDPRREAVLLSVFEHAPHLSDLSLQHPDAVIDALSGRADAVIAQVEGDLGALDRVTGPVPALSRAVSPLKERAAVAIAFSDLSGLWECERVGEALARLGRRVVETSLAWLVRLAFRHGELKVDEDGTPSTLPGFFVLAGKSFAAGEPGYCGPIDILCVTDQERLRSLRLRAADRAFERLAGDLCDSLGGLKDVPQIFRLTTARRLGTRATSLVVSTEEVMAALTGDDAPEVRAFLVNATVLAGDLEAGTRFLGLAQEQLFARTLTVEDIRRAVAPERPPSEETETGLAALSMGLQQIVDVCRLALGGADLAFREGSARDVLHEAERLGALDAYSVERLLGLLHFARRVEDRLQLVRGHASPEPAQGGELASLAALCAFSQTDLFETVIEGAIAETRQYWLSLMSEGPRARLGAASGLRADGEVSETQGTLERIGFQDGGDVGTTVDGWLSHRFERSKGGAPKRLSEIAPGLLTAVGRTRDPDIAIRRLDEVLRNAPPSVDPLMRVRDEPRLITFLADLFGNGVHARDVIAKDPLLIAELFETGAPYPTTRERWLERFSPPLAAPRFEDLRQRLAPWLSENRARLAMGLLRGDLSVLDLPPLLADLTDEAVRAVVDTVSAEHRSGRAEPGRGLAVLALGEYGAGLPSLGGTLKLTFVFDPDGEEGPTADSLQYYSELSRAIARSLSTPGPDGAPPLFAVDTSAGPGGASGDIAASLRVFRNHYVGEVGALELLSLSNARIVCGPKALTERLRAALADLITRPRKAQRVLQDADRARATLPRPDQIGSLGDIERMHGGLNDLSFIVEGLRLKHGAEHPYILSTGPLDAFEAMARAKCLEPDTAEELSQSLRFYVRLKTMLSVSGDVDLKRAPPAARLAELIAGAAGVADFRAVVPLAKGYAERVMTHYRAIVSGHDTVHSLRSNEAA